jgi:hypothetical protein
LYETCRDGSEQPSDSALEKCLKTMIGLSGQLPIFVVMDALDECPNTTEYRPPAKRYWTLWRTLSGQAIQTCSFVSLVAQSKTYRQF